MKTMILKGKDVEKILTPALANKTVEKAFRAYGRGLTQMPAKSYLYFPKGDLRSMPAYIYGEGFNIAGVKCVNVHPQNAKHHLPSVMAAVILNDPRTGFPLALLDGTYLTGIRTGAAGAVAAKYLSRKESAIAGFVGCGVQARSQLACLLQVRKIQKVKIWQFPGDQVCTREFQKWVKSVYALEASIFPDIDNVTLNSDIVVTTTPSRIPLVAGVSPGTHINAIGADAPGKQEINPEILRRAKVIVDDWEQASHSGEINVPLSRGFISKKNIHALLGDVVAGKKNGRTFSRQITVFDSTGLAIQDISCAFVVYKALRNKRSIQSIKLF